MNIAELRADYESVRYTNDPAAMGRIVDALPILLDVMEATNRFYDGYEFELDVFTFFGNMSAIVGGFD